MAQWNFNCPNCIYYKPLELCPFSACQFTPVRTVTTNKTQIVEADTVKELISNNYEPLAGYRKLGTHEEFAELKAENEQLKKRLENSVQLPCKVGDKVYTVYNHWNYPNQHFVQSHRVDKFMVWNKDIILTIAHTGNFGLRDLGKTWFLTKPEAEKALKELENNND